VLERFVEARRLVGVAMALAARARALQPAEAKTWPLAGHLATEGRAPSRSGQNELRAA